MSAPPPHPGEVLLSGVALQEVVLDAVRGVARLVCEGAVLEFTDLRATTLLGPWDGAPGVVEHVLVVAVDGGEICLEVRVRWRTVPRVYRVVCGGVRRS